MGEFDYRVERQRLLLEAEEWSKTIKSLHVHSLTSMHYETEESIRNSISCINSNGGDDNWDY